MPKKKKEPEEGGEEPEGDGEAKETPVEDLFDKYPELGGCTLEITREDVKGGVKFSYQLPFEHIAVLIEFLTSNGLRKLAERVGSLDPAYMARALVREATEMVLDYQGLRDPSQILIERMDFEFGRLKKYLEEPEIKDQIGIFLELARRFNPKLRIEKGTDDRYSKNDYGFVVLFKKKPRFAEIQSVVGSEGFWYAAGDPLQSRVEYAFWQVVDDLVDKESELSMLLSNRRLVENVIPAYNLRTRFSKARLIRYPPYE